MRRRRERDKRGRDRREGDLEAGDFGTAAGDAISSPVILEGIYAYRIKRGLFYARLRGLVDTEAVIRLEEIYGLEEGGGPSWWFSLYHCWGHDIPECLNLENPRTGYLNEDDFMRGLQRLVDTKARGQPQESCWSLAPLGEEEPVKQGNEPQGIESYLQVCLD